MSKMFGVSVVSDCWEIIFECFISFDNLSTISGFVTVTDSTSLLLDFSAFLIFGFTKVKYFFVNVEANITKSFFLFLLFLVESSHLLLYKTYLLTIIFKYKFYKIFHWHFYSIFYLQNIHHCILKNKSLNFYSLWYIRNHQKCI